ncbi:MAG: WYL domain-containing protein [Saprospiraceae bacterium]|nr:WYL domain-containing protein [Saprospiraceae bacterium]
MATNKNALIRYRTIDQCLQNRQRKWTLDSLIDACSDALYEYEGKSTNVSKRTIQLDLQLMRSDKLGYNAPIVVYDKKYYTYEDADYSITNIPITETDMGVIMESVEMLKQFKDFSLFSDLNGVLQKLEDKVYSEKNSKDSIIHLDTNKELKGLEHLDVIYQAILKKIVLSIKYQSFKSDRPSEFNFTPYILKEFNNRWFAVGKVNGRKNIQNFALDRIQKISYSLSEEYSKDNFNPDDYYKNTFGVTVLNDEQILEIVLWIDPSNAPYVLTKPFHHSQKLIKKFEDNSIIIQINVHHNFEIERLILGFGEKIEVLKPERMRNRMKYRMIEAAKKYGDNTDYNEKV